MRYIILGLIILLNSCSSKLYELNVNYQDGSKEVLRANSISYPTLNDGCIYFGDGESPAIRCGVKSFTFKTIENETKGLH
jgi:hypothetical protein